MADISAANWNEVDSSNNQTPPDGWPSATMNPSQVEPAARAIMGGVKRAWDRINATVTSGGSAGAYTYAPVNPSFPVAYVQGEIFAFKANFTSIGGDTLAIAGLAAKPLYKPTNAGPAVIAAGDIQSSQICQVVYDGNLGASGGFNIISGIANLTTVNLQTSVSGVLSVAHGGTNASAAGGAALDNISGFNTAGYVQRVSSATYSIVADGMSHQVLHGGGSWGQVDLVADTANNLPATRGGTGLASGNSGGIPYFNSTTTMAASPLLATNAILRGGGAGGAPTSSPISSDNGLIFTINANATALPTPNGGTLLQIGNSDNTQSVIELDGFGNAPLIIGRRNGSFNSSPAPVAIGTTLMGMAGQGYGATGYSPNRASVALFASEPWSDTAQGTHCTIQTTSAGTLTTAVGAIFNAPGDGGAQLAGNTNGNSQPGGFIGEYVSVIVPIASSVFAPNGITVNVAEIVALGAGDWDVWGEVWFDTSLGGPSSSNFTNFRAGIGLNSATIPNNPSDDSARVSISFSPLLTSTQSPVLPVGTCRLLQSHPFAVFLCAAVGYTSGTTNVYGKLCARRR